MEVTTIKKVALNDIHEKLNAKMTPFAGFNMPVRYSSDKDEHFAVRNSVGVFDVSHMGEFIIEGEKALQLIQNVTTNDASTLTIGKAQYSCMTNEKSGIVDDLLVYKLAENKYMLVVNASNIEKDWNWIQKHNHEGATMRNISDETSLFAVQGPKALATLQSLTSIDLASIPYYSFQEATFAGIPNVIISATGYTGAGGFELYLPNAAAETIWHKIFEAGKSYDIKPIGLGARDTLRLEMGFCLYGNDIDDTTTPLEAGLGWITKFTKNFTAAEQLKVQKEKGVAKKLVGFEMLEGGIPRSHYIIFNEKDEKIGEVTSGTISPCLNIGIGMGYVLTSYSQKDTEIFVDIRGKKHKAKIVKFPFYKVS